jgi:hypothetical protein
MRTGRPKKPMEITAEDREKLSMMARRPKSAQAMRCALGSCSVAGKG